MELVPGVRVIEGILPVANVFLVVQPDGLLLVDTGVAMAARGIMRYIRRIGFEPSALKAIFVTHGDSDHIGALHALQEQTGAETIAHEAEVALVEGREQRKAVNPSPFMRIARPLFDLLSPARPARVTRAVSDGDIVHGLRVVHVPGHSAGSVCYLLENRGVLFAGDAMTHFGGKIGLPMKAYTPDMALAKESIRAIAQLSFDTCCFGHGPAIIGNAQAAIQEFANRLQQP
jgi:glyoxylase-like metal-dependent hydrolase (beta-lactamase superfamily II)